MYHKQPSKYFGLWAPLVSNRCVMKIKIIGLIITYHVWNLILLLYVQLRAIVLYYKQPFKYFEPQNQDHKTNHNIPHIWSNLISLYPTSYHCFVLDFIILYICVWFSIFATSSKDLNFILYFQPPRLQVWHMQNLHPRIFQS